MVEWLTAAAALSVDCTVYFHDGPNQRDDNTRRSITAARTLDGLETARGDKYLCVTQKNLFCAFVFCRCFFFSHYSPLLSGI